MITRKMSVILVCGLSFVFGPEMGVVTTWAQSSDSTARELSGVRDQIAKIQADIEAIRRELQIIRELMSRSAPQPSAAARPSRVVVSVGVLDSPSLGRPDAQVTIVEFSDYQCPFCGRFHQTTMPVLKKEYIEAGKLRYVLRDFPLDSIHPNARKAAEATHCAGEQGKYWEMHDMLFENQQALQLERLKSYSRALALEPTRFEACLETGRYTARIQKDYNDGIAVGVQGTPSFIIGRTKSGNTVDGVLIRGAQPIGILRQEIERLLAEN